MTDDTIFWIIAASLLFGLALHTCEWIKNVVGL